MSTIDFGIDLGTTNSSIVSCRAGVTRVFQSTELMDVTPSVVYVGRSGRMLVGKKAYDAWIADPDNTQAEFKRWMGFSDRLTFPASGKIMSAEDLSAEVLKAMRADVARATGEDVTAAVITVPAAFGSQQCEATGRAAKAAGFLEAPLLQEPVAAAIAYGASATAQGQRWMVFDLGGGTLDIAVVSTRNGRLAVLEHQGNNRLGGKDIDRLIAENLLLANLASQFSLPDKSKNPREFDRLFRSLLRIAEQTKIALSTAAFEQVEIFNVGNDLDGKTIESSLSLTRDDLNAQLEPLLASCLSLCKRALDGARLAPADLDRLILVGGPTQMPLMREALAAQITPRLEFSIDPMTVVARGAAFYAATVARTTAAPAAAATAARSSTAAVLKLNHERASGTPKSPVAGTFANPHSAPTEIKIDSEGGVWSTGWLPVKSGRFVTDVSLTPNQPVTRFVITARGATGKTIPVSPAEFAVAYMLPMAAPPLPHTIAVELTGRDGKTTYDPIFKRHTPLPSETRRTYRAERTLRPSELNTTLPIKFWEIEVSEDPDERWWAGSIHISANKIRRPVQEGAEIEAVIKIDISRKLSVELFVPSLNQGFSDDVFVPDPPSTRDQLQEQIDLCFSRVQRLFQFAYAADRDDVRERLEMIQMKLEVISEKIAEDRKRANPDPDAALAPVDTLRKLRVILTQIEEQLESEKHMSPMVIELQAEHRWTAHVVERSGTDVDKQSFSRLSEQFERYKNAGDQRGLNFVRDAMRDLRINILHNQPWYWENLYHNIKSPQYRFTNQNQADKWIAKADDAFERKDFTALRDALNNAYALSAPDDLERAKEQAMQSGLSGGI